MFRKKIIYFRTQILVVGILGSLAFTACQRDDICPASILTTPQVRISFFDFEEREIPKPPTNLLIKISGTNSLDSVLYNRVNIAEITVPLRTNSDFTEYDFILNAAVFDSTIVDTTENTDKIIFSYIRNEIYINRACGYKVNFLDLDAELIPAEENDSTWIGEIDIVLDTIQNETNPHIIIYH